MPLLSESQMPFTPFEANASNSSPRGGLNQMPLLRNTLGPPSCVGEISPDGYPPGSLLGGGPWVQRPALPPGRGGARPGPRQTLFFPQLLSLLVGQKHSSVEQLLAVDHSARASMKNAASCEN
ncbi:hypothetical protein A7L55_19585 [Acinetobacter baumannii]|nr:hypothetical protein A7L55_19585 [Acinetobacter baumannii]